MEVLFDIDGKTESKTKDILRAINRINDAKYNGALLPNELASTIIYIGELYSNQLKNNTNKYSSEDFENLVPNFDYKTKYYQHQKLAAANNIVRETNSAALIYYEERYKENNNVVTKVA